MKKRNVIFFSPHVACLKIFIHMLIKFIFLKRKMMNCDEKKKLIIQLIYSLRYLIFCIGDFK